MVVADQAMAKCQVLDHLAAMVDKSLVLVDRANPPQHHMLQTTRLFATQQLVAADEQASKARRHSHCFAALFEAACGERWDARSAVRVNLDKPACAVQIQSDCRLHREDQGDDLRWTTIEFVLRYRLAAPLRADLAELQQQTELPQRFNSKAIHDSANALVRSPA